MKLYGAIFAVLLVASVRCSVENPDVAPVEDPVIDISFKDDPSISSLNGTWKVYCYEDLYTHEVDYKSRKNSWDTDIIVEFNDARSPHGFSGIKTTNSFGGEFHYSGSRQFRLKGVVSTLAGQPPWADEFDKFISDALYKDVSFIVNGNLLRINYSYNMMSVILVKQ